MDFVINIYRADFDGDCDAFMMNLMETFSRTCPGMEFKYLCIGVSEGRYTNRPTLLYQYRVLRKGYLNGDAREEVVEGIRAEAKRARQAEEERLVQEKLEQEKQRELILRQRRDMVTGFKIRICMTGFKIRVPIPANMRKNLLRHKLISEDRWCKACGAHYPAGSIKVHTFQSCQSRCHRNVAKCKSQV